MVGLLLGIGLAWVAGVGMTLLHPDDPSAGSVAIIVIFTAPMGLLMGAASGVGRALAQGPSNQDDEQWPDRSENDWAHLDDDQYL
jgi:hypothetical protein